MSSYRNSSPANSDIEEISFYLCSLNPVAAHNFLDALGAACELLASHPHLGRKRPDLGYGLRSYPVGNYLIFYRVEQDGVEIVRVVYGGRNLPGMFTQ